MSEIQTTPNGPVTGFLGDLDACEGKTIKSVRDESVYWTDYRVIRFTDGTAIAFRENDEGGHSLYGETFDGRFSLRDRVYFGLADHADYEAQQQREAAQRTADAEQRERTQYESLKAKFEK